MMHLLVENVDAWWRRGQAQGVTAKDRMKVEPPEERPWGMRDFVLVDPAAVLWRMGQNTKRAETAPASDST
jgi:uncharacterized glyoxalase superfamily protein PhnB